MGGFYGREEPMECQQKQEKEITVIRSNALRNEPGTKINKGHTCNNLNEWIQFATRKRMHTSLIEISKRIQLTNNNQSSPPIPLAIIGLIKISRTLQ